MTDAIVQAHLAHLARLNRRPGSIDQRRWALARLCRFIAPTPILEVSIEQLRAFTERGTHGASTQAAEVTHIRMFFKWAMREELVTFDPTIRLERPSLPEGVPRPMNTEHVRFTLAHAPRRLYPWFHLATYTGMRGGRSLGP